jgi:hypothetical protein
MNEKKAGQQKSGIINLTMGTLFVLYGIALFIFFNPSLEIGFFLNNIMIVLDVSWMLIIGGTLIVIGLLALYNRLDSTQPLFISGVLMIYTTVFIICSIIFNALATPQFQSYGRVITYTLQVIGRLFNPAVSFDFFIPLFSFTIVIALSVLFKKHIFNSSE